MFNLSNENLSKSLSNLLEQGPSHKFDQVEFCHYINQYYSLPRNKEFFHSENSSGISNLLINSFKTVSNWTPPSGRNENIDFYILKIDKELDVLVHDLNTSTVNLRDNLSSNQRRALHGLKFNNNIVIKPAVKRGSIVIMDKDNYMKESHTQLYC